MSKLKHDELKVIENQLCEAIKQYIDIQGKIVDLKRRKRDIMDKPPSYVMFPYESPKTRT